MKQNDRVGRKINHLFRLENLKEEDFVSLPFYFFFLVSLLFLELNSTISYLKVRLAFSIMHMFTND